MGYESRRDRKYYYGARRVGRRVIKQYLGCGAKARSSAAEVAERQSQRRRQRLLESQRATELVLLREEFERFWEASERALRLALLAHNYHRHRGEWRRRRDLEQRTHP